LGQSRALGGRLFPVGSPSFEVFTFMGQFSRISPATILVVESEAIVRLELAAWLEDQGLFALTACNADEAMVVLDRHPNIEIMMTDIDMTGSMDGIRLARHVRDRWPPVEIIVASGWPRTGCADLPDGVLFVPKPINRDRLLIDLDCLVGHAALTRGALARSGGVGA
jgi:DNA-binding NtrC family response regulator